jgi:glycosyltransferase involved in cell wall biosynthesis
MNSPISGLKIALLTGGIDKHYACGLTQSLASMGVIVDVLCNAEMSTREMQEHPNINHFALYSSLQRGQSRLRKLIAIIAAYARILHYAATSSAPVFHILWNYKFRLFDRTLFLIFCKLMGKEIVFTAHNVNKGERDGTDSFLNQVSLRIQYRLVDHILVHTVKMKEQLVQMFGVREEKISIVPFGTYDMVPQSELTSAEARQHLGLSRSDQTILFFGHIAPYKGIDLLVDAFARLAGQNKNYRLVIAGGPMKESQQQWRQVQQVIEESAIRDQVLQHDWFIADHMIERYFKAADVLVLPYTHIFQSGVLFMSYTFGLPVIATDIGSFSRSIVEGFTGYLCRPNDPQDLAAVIDKYFSSEMFKNIDEQRIEIKSFIHASNSWEVAAAKTSEVYGQLIAKKLSRSSSQRCAPDADSRSGSGE